MRDRERGGAPTGAEALVETLRAAGLRRVFANPGTSEMHLAAALEAPLSGEASPDRTASPARGAAPEIETTLCLQENVATGAADGYARLAGRPAATLLHLGPGLANGLANLHNARRGAVPVLNLVGDHAEDHLRFDAPLTADLGAIAGSVSHYVGRARSARTAAAEAARAYAAAASAPGQVATLILPADAAWSAAEGPAAPIPPTPFAPVPPEAVERAAAALRAARRPALLLRGPALYGEGLEAAGRVAAAADALLFCDTFAPRLASGAGAVAVRRLPYFAEAIQEALAPVDLIVLAGAAPPVAFFGRPGGASWLTPEGCALVTLSHPHEDGPAALAALSATLGPAEPARWAPARPEAPSGALDAAGIGAALARLLPENAVLVDEMLTAGPAILPRLPGAAPHDHISLTGGSIGDGLPMALGAALAAPDRKIVCVHGDGGAMYAPQSLWSMAREKADVTMVILSNRGYRILSIELERLGLDAGPKTRAMLDLGGPAIDWVSLARGMGVEASRAETAEAFSDQLASALSARGPRLVEAAL